MRENKFRRIPAAAVGFLMFFLTALFAALLLEARPDANFTEWAALTSMVVSITLAYNFRAKKFAAGWATFAFVTLVLAFSWSMLTGQNESQYRHSTVTHILDFVGEALVVSFFGALVGMIVRGVTNKNGRDEFRRAERDLQRHDSLQRHVRRQYNNGPQF